MKKLLIILGVVSGCATNMPAEQRRVDFIDQTNATKQSNYNGALSYLAKNMGDSKAAIQVKDPEQGRIILKGNTSCNELRQFGDINEYTLHFNLDFLTKDKKVKMSFEDLKILGPNGLDPLWGNLQISSKENLQKIKPCLNRLRSNLLKAINSPDENNW